MNKAIQLLVRELSLLRKVVFEVADMVKASENRVSDEVGEHHADRVVAAIQKLNDFYSAEKVEIEKIKEELCK
ncbi:MAG: hypothetical protein EBU96_05135 [Actinobacteria bacterium]|nr:hypothetical protein [Actinomycetota bacterium]